MESKRTRETVNASAFTTPNLLLPSWSCSSPNSTSAKVERSTSSAFLKLERRHNSELATSFKHTDTTQFYGTVVTAVKALHKRGALDALVRGHDLRVQQGLILDPTPDSK